MNETKYVIINIVYDKEEKKITIAQPIKSKDIVKTLFFMDYNWEKSKHYYKVLKEDKDGFLCDISNIDRFGRNRSLEIKLLKDNELNTLSQEYVC